MNVIVTGGMGFIGSELVRQLRAAGDDPLSASRSGPGLAIDLCEPGALDAHLAPGDLIFHLAGSADVGKSLSDPLGDFRANTLATVNVLESARQAGCRVVLASTGSVYDPAAASPIAEDALLAPVSPYGAAKAAAEIYARTYRRAYGVDIRVVRLFSIYGPGRHGMAIADFAERLRTNPARLEIRGDGGQRRDYLHVSDAARALRLVAERGEAGGVYNVGSGEGRRIIDLARAVAAAVGFPGCVIAPEGQSQRGELYEMTADISRLTALGFAPRIGFEEGLAETVAWLIEDRKV